MSSFAWVNGSFVEEDSASVSIRDTGLLHAAGVFTTMRAYEGKVFRLEQHLARIRRSSEFLFVPLQYKDAELSAAVEELLQKNELADARLRLTNTRGSARQDPLHGLALRPNTFLTATDLEPYPAEFYQRGMTVILVDDQKLNPYDLQAGHKTLNYFTRLAALRDASRQSAGEALWFNVHNFLQSGCVSNVFIVKDGVLITPPTPEEMQDGALRESMTYPRSAVLPGIMRQAVLEHAESLGQQVRLAAININELLDADEVFLTNSIMEVMPVCRIEKSVVGDDRPGEVTTALADAIKSSIRR